MAFVDETAKARLAKMVSHLGWQALWDPNMEFDIERLIGKVDPARVHVPCDATLELIMS